MKTRLNGRSENRFTEGNETDKETRNGPSFPSFASVEPEKSEPKVTQQSWTDWQSFTYNGPISLMDVGATGAERRFYRAVSP